MSNIFLAILFYFLPNLLFTIDATSFRGCHDMSRQSSSVDYFNYEERRATLKKLREQAGISQGRLAELAGVSLFTVSRFEGGVRDVKPKTLAKLEEAMADIIAGQRMTQMLHAHRGQTVPLSVMTSAPRSRKREQADELARLREQVVILRDMVEMLKQRDANWHEAFTLQDEVIRLYEAERVKRPKEAGAMVKRARLLIAKR